jgi:hypothetical protein
MFRAQPGVPRPRSIIDQSFRPARGVKAAPAGGSGLLLYAPGGRCVSLNGSGSRFWTLLERGASLRTIQSRMHEEYGAPDAWLESELPSLLEALMSAGLIERIA